MPLSVTATTANNAAIISMAIAAGETVQEVVTLSPFNLSGYTLKMQIGFATPLTLSSNNGGITILNAGQLQINIADTASTAFIPGSYPYEFWAISGGGDATRLWTGTFTVLKSITPIP